MAQRAFGLCFDVDLALAKPLQEVVGGRIDKFDLVGLVENPVWNCLDERGCA